MLYIIYSRVNVCRVCNEANHTEISYSIKSYSKEPKKEKLLPSVTHIIRRIYTLPFSNQANSQDKNWELEMGIKVQQSPVPSCPAPSWDRIAPSPPYNTPPCLRSRLLFRPPAPSHLNPLLIWSHVIQQDQRSNWKSPRGKGTSVPVSPSGSTHWTLMLSSVPYQDLIKMLCVSVDIPQEDIIMIIIKQYNTITKIINHNYLFFVTK